EHAAPGKARDKKREKKHGPPRERPPVNGGDIVFGKIIEITDEAILVDIPGKAKAIFDRRELLLSDEDDAPPPRELHAAAAEDDSPADAAPPADGQDAAPAPETAVADTVAAEASEVAAAAEPEPAPEAAPELAPAPEAEPAPAPVEVAADASAEPRREPKVPRVVLEVGADFIAVVHSDGGRGGLVVLTHHPHRAERAKPAIEKAFNDKTLVEGLVTGVIKGGIEVDIDGLRAFAPGSHVDMHLGADLSYLVARRLPFLVTQYAKRGRDLVLSRKSMIEDEAKKARAEALARLKIGEEIEGIVRSVVPFGAFVDVGGIEGLVPLQEMSHNRGDGPSDVFKAGEPTRVKVIKIDDKGKIWLSHKATIPDPWQQVAQKYAQGTKHAGKVARLQPFGAFIELESGVDGLIHLADLSVNRIESPADVVKVGDAVDVVVSHVDPANHKIALHPAPTGEAANETPQRVAPHKPLKCKVVAIESGGLVVRILGVTGRNSRGYITSAGTGTPRGTELRKAFKVGQELEAKVIELDPRRGEVKLSIKALSEELERSAYQQYRQQLKAEAKFTFGDLLAKKGPTPR
ncbi:MAG: S1 RNA-binding domain-containing protein, partial [Polyangiaceae bacterium]